MTGDAVAADEKKAKPEESASEKSASKRPMHASTTDRILCNNICASPGVDEFHNLLLCSP